MMTKIINIHGNQKSKGIEVADIMEKHIAEYREKYFLLQDQSNVAHDILNCRTAWFGGHVEECDNCGRVRHAYNSCRNRHCPKCQILTKENWLEARKAELLPVSYFHNVFTLPHELNPVILCNKKVMLALLFRSVSETLLQFGKNPKNGLEGKLGFIAILHTWDQLLNAHFHLHCLVPGGALSSDRSEFIHCKNDFLFPEKPLAGVFRGKFMDYLKRAYKSGQLIFPGKTQPMGTAKGFKELENKLWKKDWVVDIQDPIKNPEWVLEYLGRYTHRVAISNNRILSLEDGMVTFTFKNREKNTIEKKTLNAVEFIRRFLLHVLPSGFMRIRHYGFLSNRYKREYLKCCREALGIPSEPHKAVEKSIREMMIHLTGKDISKCPCCGKGTMEKISKIEERSGPNIYYQALFSNNRSAA